MSGKVIVAAGLLLAACGRSLPEDNSNNRMMIPDETSHPQSPQPLAPTSSQPAIPPPATGPDARTPLGEPKRTIDPKSIEAAGQVVQHYGALVEQRRFAEAARLWGDPAAAAVFARALGHSQVHLEIGEFGGAEGAAGSIYTTVPVVFYGDRFRRRANVVLRRVNDVPGSTEAQRRWHIERIEWRD